MKTVRIWFGCSLGLAISMFTGWGFGFLAILLPLFVLSLSDSLNIPLLLMILGAAIMSTLVSWLVWDLLKVHPTLVLGAVSTLFFGLCIAMTHRPLFLIGYIGLIISSIVLSLASYPFVDIEDLCITVWVYAALNIVICSLAYWLFPEKQPKSISKQENSPEYDPVQVVMIWGVIMLTFVVFQVADLYDSVAAHASVLVIMAPMSSVGTLKMAKVRVLGTLMGCALGLGLQLTLGLWLDNAFLYWLGFTIAMGPFCYWHTQGQVKMALASSAMASLTVPLTTVLVPGQQDAVFASLYRFSSIFIAVASAAFLILLLQTLSENRLQYSHAKS
ncbi:DUF2955 domain-containing protein [Vibrio agarivorans]|uniref:DUF2955 domain-containing protein n=1 Tax=Vibrio agarivorans TaxID=153622 RepID=UPI0022309721|nr:DUF2955 domain-containing protein [Vibrio agarivorans]